MICSGPFFHFFRSAGFRGSGCRLASRPRMLSATDDSSSAPISRAVSTKMRTAPYGRLRYGPKISGCRGVDFRSYRMATAGYCGFTGIDL
jgi:hypothetical protein